MRDKLKEVKSMMNIFQKSARIERGSEFHFGSIDLEASLGWSIGNLDHEFRKKFSVGDPCLEVRRDV